MEDMDATEKHRCADGQSDPEPAMCARERERERERETHPREEKNLDVRMEKPAPKRIAF